MVLDPNALTQGLKAGREMPNRFSGMADMIKNITQDMKIAAAEKRRSQEEQQKIGIQRLEAFQKLGYQPKNAEGIKALLENGDFSGWEVKPQMSPENVLSMLGNVPKGTSFNLKTDYGSFDIPLNPALNQEQAQSVAAAAEVQDDVNSLKNLFNQKPSLAKGWSLIQAGKETPYWLIGDPDIQEVKRLRDQLAARIPFAKGGKQLTPFEAKTLFALLPNPGQNMDVIIKNLDKFTREFNRLSEIATKGTAGIASASTSTQEQWIRMQKPDGSIVEVHPEDIQRALQSGYRRQ